MACIISVTTLHNIPVGLFGTRLRWIQMVAISVRAAAYVNITFTNITEMSIDNFHPKYIAGVQR